MESDKGLKFACRGSYLVPQAPLQELRSQGSPWDHLSLTLCSTWLLDACFGQADGWATFCREDGVPEPPATALRHREAWGGETTGRNQHLLVLNLWFTTQAHWAQAGLPLKTRRLRLRAFALYSVSFLWYWNEVNRKEPVVLFMSVAEYAGNRWRPNMLGKMPFLSWTHSMYCALLGHYSFRTRHSFYPQGVYCLTKIRDMEWVQWVCENSGFLSNQKYLVWKIWVVLGVEFKVALVT